MAAKRKPRRADLGVTLDDYDRMLAEQGGGCAICGAPPKTRRLDVDHDHKTGQVRGLLCVRCNRAVPSWTLSPEWFLAAARYVERHRQLREQAAGGTLSGVTATDKRCGYCGELIHADALACELHADLEAQYPAGRGLPR